MRGCGTPRRSRSDLQVSSTHTHPHPFLCAVLRWSARGAVLWWRQCDGGPSGAARCGGVRQLRRGLGAYALRPAWTHTIPCRGRGGPRLPADADRARALSAPAIGEVRPPTQRAPRGIRQQHRTARAAQPQAQGTVLENGPFPSSPPPPPGPSSAPWQPPNGTQQNAASWHAAGPSSGRGRGTSTIAIETGPKLRVVARVILRHDVGGPLCACFDSPQTLDLPTALVPDAVPTRTPGTAPCVVPQASPSTPAWRCTKRTPAKAGCPAPGTAPLSLPTSSRSWPGHRSDPQVVVLLPGIVPHTPAGTGGGLSTETVQKGGHTTRPSRAVYTLHINAPPPPRDALEGGDPPPPPLGRPAYAQPTGGSPGPGP